MASLQPAHRGYEYQDLLIAARSVDLLLERLASLIVDEKLVDDDRFDDLSTVDVHGHRERIQFKYTESQNQVLSLSTFTSDTRQLKLDKLLVCAIADRDGPGSDATSFGFRVILRDRRPTSKLLLRYLSPAVHDPGPFLSSMASVRLQFDSDILWPENCSLDDDSTADHHAFSFLQSIPGITRPDLVWFCERLIIEVEAPAMSGNLAVPDAAEVILLDRVTLELGAGQYPNQNRAPIDVSHAFVSAARMARQGRIQLGKAELLQAAQLRSDFGTVSHRDPVDSDLEVARPTQVEELAAVAREMAQVARPIVLIGPPGQGKSWTCKQLVSHLRNDGWLVAEHYCFLGSADHEREMRVYTDSIFGTLLDLIGDVDPSLVQRLRPRFAVSPLALEDAVGKSLQNRPDRPVAIVIDGLDHVSRVASPSRTLDPSWKLAEALATLTLPIDSVLIVLSQPGRHLDPLLEIGAASLEVAGFSLDETRTLVRRYEITGEELADETLADEVVDAIFRRAQGNALYSTYLCRELQIRGGPVVDALALVNALPAYDGSLEGYYRYLYETLGDEAAWVAEYLAFLDFTVTPSELGDIQPDRAHHVRRALNVLGPVLKSDVVAGVMRIYHESFSRYLTSRLEDSAVKAINDRIAQWLSGKGFFADERAYRFLLPTLARAGDYSNVLDLIDDTFLANSLAAGYPPTSILSNLAVAVGAAVAVNDWPAAVRSVELGRGASTFEFERLDTVMIDFADVPIAVIGGEDFASRLLFERQPVVPARVGLQICNALDEYGIAAPWEPYIDAFVREQGKDNVAYGASSDAAAAVAIFRGRLRLWTLGQLETNESQGDEVRDNGNGLLATPEMIESIARYVDEDDRLVCEVAIAVFDTVGPDITFEVASRIAEPAAFSLAVAQRMHDIGTDSLQFLRFRDLASQENGAPGNVRALLNLGMPIAAILVGQQQERRAQLLRLTDQVQDPRAFDKVMDEWLDLCVLAAVDDPIGLAAAEARVQGGFWYRNWLQFAIQIARAEADKDNHHADLALGAIELLNVETYPFAGEPRACDLYGIHRQVRETIRRAVDLLDDATWHRAIDILTAMSGSVSTTLQGAMHGPFKSDDLLHLAVDTGTSPERCSATAALIQKVIDENSAERYYTDLAVYRLFAARLELRTNNLSEAVSHWVEACRLLSGYGFRKDITIFEVLDPLTELIKADPRRGRERVAAVQSLAERVPSHTDRKETRHAWTSWWNLLAQADPVALANLVGPAMVSRCNLPSWLHERARQYLWKTWQSRTDPVLASLLRNTLDINIDADDAVGLQRLLGVTDRPYGLDAQVTSLADERPVKYSESNGAELVERDEKLVHEMNVVAKLFCAPQISLGPLVTSPLQQVVRESRNAAPSTSYLDDAALAPVMFPSGISGLAYAARAWRQRPYEARTQQRDFAKFTNAIGYRLIDLVQVGREDDAILSLWSIADADRFGYDQDLLRTIAEGLERLGHAHLAAVAFTLHWTRSRGGGGWLTFGGESAIDSLRRSLALDRDAALQVLGEEIQRVINGNSWGVTQAIIYAFALTEMPAPEGSVALDVAFQCWDEAATVIATRAPRVHAWDDPDEPYAPPERDDGAQCQGDLELAFTCAIVAGVSHAGREQKRRSMLSLRMLLDYAPSAAGQALQQLLPVMSDPATVVWILRLIDASKNRESIIPLCESGIADLTASGYLVVRSLARRLLLTGSDAEIPPTPPDNSLLDQDEFATELWIPPGISYEPDQSHDSALEAVLERQAGIRIARGEVLLPRYGLAVLRRLRLAIDDEPYKRRLRRQADALGRANGVPDAYLVLEETIESALQEIAAGGRLAMLANGQGLLGPDWEDQLADAIKDDPVGSLDLEALRHPRPQIPIPPGRRPSEWNEILNHLSGESNASDLVHAYRMNDDDVVVGTKIRPLTDCPMMIGGAFGGWRIIGSAEHRVIGSSERRRERTVVERYFGLEIRDSGDKADLTNPPLYPVDSVVWELTLPPDAVAESIIGSHSFVGYDREMERFDDAAYGLGLPERIMVPTGWLRALWRLDPLADYLLGDENGGALALVTWRTEYERSDYHLPWPKMEGSAIVVRPDLLHRLESHYGERLIYRDFIVGNESMIESITSTN